MPNLLVLGQIELSELTQSVDDSRVAEDPFKLPAAWPNSPTPQQPTSSPSSLPAH